MADRSGFPEGLGSDCPAAATERHWRCRRSADRVRSQLSIRSSNLPALPTNGRPIRSSSPPGASPTSMTREPGTPSANTKLRGGPLQRAVRRIPPSRSAASPDQSPPRASARAVISAASGRFVPRRRAERGATRRLLARRSGASAPKRFAACSILHCGRTVSETIMRRFVKRIGDANPNPPAERLHGLERAQWMTVNLPSKTSIQLT